MISGRFFPRSFALRRTPLQASALKEYFGSGFAIKIRDKRDSTTRLGDSPKFRVDSSPSD